MTNDRDAYQVAQQSPQERADTWEENHQILSEHYERMTRERDTWKERAKDAEADLAAVSHERDAWQRRFESAIAERDNETARAEKAEQTMDRWMDSARDRGSGIDELGYDMFVTLAKQEHSGYAEFLMNAIGSTKYGPDDVERWKRKYLDS